MSRIPLLALVGALVIAILVLGFCAYEIVWRIRRLRRDLQQLQAVGAGLAQVHEHLDAARQRLAHAGAH